MQDPAEPPHSFTDVPFSIPSTLLTVLGTMIAFVISYRTSSAYDRYWEGRRLWSTVVFASRIWARTVWIACPDSLSEKPIADPEDRERDAVMAVVEKKTMVNLVQAFNIALKHCAPRARPLLRTPLPFADPSLLLPPCRPPGRRRLLLVRQSPQTL